MDAVTAFMWRLAMYASAILAAVMIGVWGTVSVLFFVTSDEAFIRQSLAYGLVGAFAMASSFGCMSFYLEKQDDEKEASQPV
jgi:hypothetical protein